MVYCMSSNLKFLKPKIMSLRRKAICNTGEISFFFLHDSTKVEIFCLVTTFDQFVSQQSNIHSASKANGW